MSPYSAKLVMSYGYKRLKLKPGPDQAEPDQSVFHDFKVDRN